MRDMSAFIIILVFIVMGFALIFLEFQRDDVYGVQLYSTYQVLYGNVPEEVSTVSQQLFAALILFLLNVVLMNLLISIMGDSYDKVQERRVLTDSRTRLEIILESMTYMRIFAKEKIGTRGHLIFCEGEVDQLDDNGDNNNEWEGRINVIKRALRQNDQKTDDMSSKVSSMQKQIDSMQNETQKQMDSMQHGVQRRIDSMQNRMDFMQNQMTSMQQGLEKQMQDMRDQSTKSHTEIMEAIQTRLKQS